MDLIWVLGISHENESKLSQSLIFSVLIVKLNVDWSFVKFLQNTKVGILKSDGVMGVSDLKVQTFWYTYSLKL